MEGNCEIKFLNNLFLYFFKNKTLKKDLRRCWKVPYIVYYCNLFEQKLDLVDLRVDEFEEAIIDDCGMERNLVVIHLLQKLLKPFINRSVEYVYF